MTTRSNGTTPGKGPGGQTPNPPPNYGLHPTRDTPLVKLNRRGGRVMPGVRRYRAEQLCMQKKVKTTPLQREILWALADTGERSLPALLDGLSAKSPALSPDALRKEVARSLGVLWRAGCLYLMRVVAGERQGVLAPEMAALDLGRMLAWDEARGGWGVSEAGTDSVIAHLTAGGVHWLDLIAAQSSDPVPVWRPRQ